MWFRKSKPKAESKPDPTQVMRDLREAAFARHAAEVGLSPGPGHERVWSVIVDMGYPGATVTLLVGADGTTSMYFSSGGGFIGAGEHPHIRDVSQRLISRVDAHLNDFAATTNHSVPALAQARVYARTFDDLRVAEAPLEMMGRSGHPLSPVLNAANDVITAIRELAEQKRPQA